MKKAIIALIVTCLCGFGGLALGLQSALPIPEIGAIIAVAVMGAFIIYFNDKKN